MENASASASSFPKKRGGGRSGEQLFVDVLPVAGMEHGDAVARVIDRVKHSILSLVQSVTLSAGDFRVTITMKLLAIVGARILAQFQYASNNLPKLLRIEFLEILDDPRIKSQIIGHLS